MRNPKSDRKIKLSALVKARYPDLGAGEIEIKILSGEILVDGEKIIDKNRLVAAAAQVAFRQTRTFVSRGGEKLAHIISSWEVVVRDLVWLDIGASTGGFSDCLLQHGARLVYAVDVGYNQLDYSLRKDARIVCLERTNIGDLTRDSFPCRPEGAVCDMSFRSIEGIAGHILGLISGETFIALIKPQFEYRHAPAAFRGVVRSTGEVYAIVADLVKRLADEGVFVQRTGISPIRGHKGNRELFFLLSGRQTMQAEEVLAGCRILLQN